MKRTLITVAIAMLSMATFAQSGSGFGIKGGLNYGANGDYFESTEAAAKEPGRNVGYHLGVFGKLGDKIYFRPEIVYTKTKSDYDGDKFDMSKLDVPLLVGINVIGPVNVFAGPAFQYILNSDFAGISIESVDNDFTVGLNIGAGLTFGKLGVDLRYERGFSENEAHFIYTNITTEGGSRIDTRPDQLILSLSLAL